MTNNSLGGTIAKYKYIYRAGKRNSAAAQYDIQTIVDRLEGYKKYQRTLYNERQAQKRKDERRVIKKMRKRIQKKIYGRVPVHNPYIAMYRSMTTMPDPKLIERYQDKNVFTFHEFRHMTLPKSGHQVTAGNAWHGLIRSWKGFRAARGDGNPQREEMYASATQKWSYVLELPIPHFPEIGMSAEGFLNGLKLRENFTHYQFERVGDE